MKGSKTDRHVYRLPPCPAFDIEGVESWLSDMAEEGLFLVDDGLYFGIAEFERGTPRPVRYRLEAAKKGTNLMADNFGNPNPEQICFTEMYSWEYVAKRGGFHVYRSFDSSARELNTDPQVQASTLNTIKKYRSPAVYAIILWGVLYPFVLKHVGVFLAMLHMGTWLFTLTSLFVLWLIIDDIALLVAIGRLKNRLKADGRLQSSKDWRKGAVFYYIRRIAKPLLAIVLVCISLGVWSNSVMGKDKVQLGSYDSPPPFASMSDIAGGDIAGYRMTMAGMGFNTVKEWNDVLAPMCIKYDEHAEITLPDGSIISGGYYVDYYETRSPFIAERIAIEMFNMDFWKDNFELILPPDMDAECDKLFVYSNNLHFPTVVAQLDNKVICAALYQTSDTEIPLEEWVEIVVSSIGK